MLRAKVCSWMTTIQVLYILRMGQGMLESCEMECQKIGIETRTRTRSQTYFSNLGAQLPHFAHNELEDLKRSKASVLRNNEFLLELNALPSHYAEFVNHLFVSKAKFQDKVFPACANSIMWGANQEENDWARISDMSQEAISIYRRIREKNKTKIIQALGMIEQNLPGCLQEIKPVYVGKVGLAMCKLCINGSWEEVVIDDQIPTSHLRNYTPANGWYFLVEKAFAKLIGSYAFIEEFTLPELFQEITGLPYEVSKRKGEGWLNRDSSVRMSQLNINSFKEVFEDEKVCYLQGGDENSDVYNVRIIPGHTIRGFTLQDNTKSASIFRIQVEKTQKISLRISCLNPKFQTAHSQSSYIQSQLILYKVANGLFTEHEKDNITIGNSLYLACPFMKLQAGEYVLYVRRDDLKRRTSLVCYAGDGFKIKQVHSKQQCNQILTKLKKYQRK